MFVAFLIHVTCCCSPFLPLIPFFPLSPLTPLLNFTLATFCARVVACERKSRGNLGSGSMWTFTISPTTIDGDGVHSTRVCIASSLRTVVCAPFCSVANVYMTSENTEHDTHNSLLGAQSSTDDLPEETKAAQQTQHMKRSSRGLSPKILSKLIDD